MKARKNIIQMFKLCFKCLQNHKVGSCDQDNSEYCGGQHHNLLCYKKANDDNSASQPPRETRPPMKPQQSRNLQSIKETGADWDQGDWNKPTHSKYFPK